MDLTQIEKELGFPVDLIDEGEVKVVVPSMSFYVRSDGIYEPAHAPVFYNPKAKFNRDTAIEIARIYRASNNSLTVLEPLAGSGVRSVRYAKEANADFVLAADLNPLAIRLLNVNAKLNSVDKKIRAIQEDAHVVLHSKKIRETYYDIVDIDPFGSPIPFLDGAVRSVKRNGLIALTATDTAALSGARPNTALRRYSVKIVRTPFSKEVAIRTLISAAIRLAAIREVALRPLFSFFKDYYVRVTFKAERGAGRVDETLKNLGYLYINGLEVIPIKGYPLPEDAVSNPRKLIGPIWLGNLTDEKFFKDKLEIVKNEEIKKFLLRILEEDSIGVPYSYSIESICSSLKTHMPKPKLVVERLKELGYRAVITHYDYRNVKTNAPLDVVMNIVRDLSPR
ncbi:N2,N2-dimethylguanosine tRNA methyltransferase [Ignicoccus islandicus DSM 13165]|uniref:tRNA (guanine(26)-N(2))-dimethyltransferase n=1 Tax=Ignicoccus islandicus DSM 13165 TaxID=940295 RepID=A0A0U3DW55_9CREN|nr:tRNA (guanine(10)-N(2))-dimethyltransferase [Ignicoccus islandicus]ALU11706.1 N2,N2-dimethylguanosine tRNA methyltransferase [Ignicoccus islandicus DSM 13165]